MKMYEVLLVSMILLVNVFHPGLASSAGGRRQQDDSGRIQRDCGERFGKCAKKLDKFKMVGDTDEYMSKLRTQGLSAVCGDVLDVARCAMNVLEDQQCGPYFPPFIRTMVLKSNDAAQFFCVQKLSEFDKHWGCFFDVDVRNDLESCQNIDNALQQCNVNGFVTCAQQTFSSNSKCKPGATELVREAAQKFVDLMPNCQTARRYHKMFKNFMNRK